MNPSFSPRTQLSDEESVALVVAVELLMTPHRVVDHEIDAPPAWRFSGRWFEHSRRLA